MSKIWGMIPPIPGPFEKEWPIRVVPGQVDPSCQPSNHGFQLNFAYRVVLARKDPCSNIRSLWLIVFEMRSGHFEVIYGNFFPNRFLGMKFFSIVDMLYIFGIRKMQGLWFYAWFWKKIENKNLTFDQRLRSLFDLKGTRNLRILISIIKYWYILPL